MVPCGGGCPTHQRTFRSIPGFYPRDVRSTSLTSCDNQEGLLIFPNGLWGLSHGPKPLRGSVSLPVQWLWPFLLACVDDLPSNLVQNLCVSFLCWREGGDSIPGGAWPRSHQASRFWPFLPLPVWPGAQSSTSAGLTSSLKWNSVSVLRSHLLFPVAARMSFSSSKQCSFFFYFFSFIHSVSYLVLILSCCYSTLMWKSEKFMTIWTALGYWVYPGERKFKTPVISLSGDWSWDL